MWLGWLGIESSGFKEEAIGKRGDYDIVREGFKKVCELTVYNLLL